MPRTIDFFKTANANVKRQSGSRHRRRAEDRQIMDEALVQAKKELQGMSIPAMKALIRRKVKERKRQ